MSLIPDWLLVSMTGAALCCIVLGRWRWAALLGTPALFRFLLWPLAWHYVTALPPLLLLLIIVIVLPVIAARAVRRLLSIASSRRAADHAIGQFFGHALISFFRRRDRR
jgi:hypothetical protein